MTPQQESAVKPTIDRLSELSKSIRANNKALGEIQIQSHNLIDVLKHDYICLQQIEFIIFGPLSNPSSKSLGSINGQIQNYIDTKIKECCRQLIPSFGLLVKNLQRWIETTTMVENDYMNKSAAIQRVTTICQFCQRQIQQRKVERVYQQITNQPRLMNAKILIEADDHDMDDEQQKQMIQRQIISYNLNQINIKSKIAKADTYLTSLLQCQQAKYQQITDLIKAPAQNIKLQFNSKFINKFIQQFSESFHHLYTTSTRKTLQSLVKRVQQNTKKQLQQSIAKQFKENYDNHILKKERKNNMNSAFLQHKKTDNLGKNQLNNDSATKKINTIQSNKVSQLQNEKYEIRKAKTLIEDLRLQLSKVRQQNQAQLENLIFLKSENANFRNLIEKSKEQTTTLHERMSIFQRKLDVLSKQNEQQKINVYVQTQQIDRLQAEIKLKSKKQFKSNKTVQSSNSNQLQKLKRRGSDIFSITEMMVHEDEEQFSNLMFKQRFRASNSNSRNSSNLEELSIANLKYFGQEPYLQNQQKKQSNGISCHLSTQKSQAPYQDKKIDFKANGSKISDLKSVKTVKQQINLKNQQIKIKRHSRVSKQKQMVKQFVNGRYRIGEQNKVDRNKFIDSVKSVQSNVSVKNLNQYDKQAKKRKIKQKLNQFSKALTSNRTKSQQKLPKLNSCAIQTFYFSSLNNPLDEICSQNKQKYSSSTLRSKNNLNKTQKLFTISDFDLLGGISQSFKNKINGDSKEQLIDEQLKLLEEIAQHIEQLNKFKSGIYKKVLGFLQNPWQTVANGEIIDVKEQTLGSIREKIKQILIYHKDKCKQLPCCHLSLFMDKIGLPCS